MRANPLHQLFQPLKSLILKTLSFSSSLAESQNISVAVLQPPLKASCPSLLACGLNMFSALNCCFIVCRLKRLLFCPGWNHMLLIKSLFILLCFQLQCSTYQMRCVCVFLHTIYNNTTSDWKWTSHRNSLGLFEIELFMCIISLGHIVAFRQF